MKTYLVGLGLLILLTSCANDGVDNLPGDDGVDNLPRDSGSISGVLTYPGVDIGTPIAEDASTLPSQFEQEIVSGDVFIQFKPHLQPQNLQTLSVKGKKLNFKRSMKIANVPEFRLYHTSSLNQAETFELMEILRQNPNVLSVSPNQIFYPTETPNDQQFEFQWNFQVMNLPNAWDIEDGVGSNVTVAVVDTGVVNHPDLVANLLPGYDFVSGIGADGDGRDNDPSDADGESFSSYHGTHVAGTIAASTNNGIGFAGVSWGAKVVPVRVLGRAGTSEDIIDGARWAAGFPVAGVPTNPNPARILNLSLGGPGFCYPLYESAFQEITDAGVIVVVAAGNQNNDATVFSPGNCGNVITVGATDSNNARASYSNFGETIDIMAPGGDTSLTIPVGGQFVPAGVYSTVFLDASQQFGYLPLNGTSMAAPHISGLVALMLAKDPSLTFQTVLQRLQESATPLSAEACSNGNPYVYVDDCGPGLVDAAKTLASIGADPSTEPVPAAPASPPTEQLTTYVAAFFCAVPSCGFPDTFEVDEARSQLVALEARFKREPYEIGNLSSGEYVAAAWQDLDDDAVVDPGEPFGVYSNQASVTLSVPEGQTVGNINIELEPYTLSTSTNTPSVRPALVSALNAASKNISEE